MRPATEPPGTASFLPSAATLRRALLPTLAAGVEALSACGSAPTREGAAPPGPAPAERTAAVEQAVARVRAATAPYHALDSAVAAGYARHVARCFEDSTRGAMGFHHVNRRLLDDRVEVERPEILLYSRTSAGEYTLDGVEYIVPYTARPRDAKPPTVMGLELKRSDSLALWYLHAWVWKANPAGLFADWNPAVKC
jgi:hypothetical protein